MLGQTDMARVDRTAGGDSPQLNALSMDFSFCTASGGQPMDSKVAVILTSLPLLSTAIKVIPYDSCPF